MAVSILGTITVHETIAHSGFSIATHSVTSGTDTLLALYISRNHTANVGTPFTATWAGNALTTIKEEPYPINGNDDIIHWVAARNTPTTGTQTFAFDTGGFAQRGGTLVLLNLDGTDQTTLMGSVAAQRASGSAVATVSLTITPQTTGNLILAFYAMASATTVTLFDGVGYTTIGTDGQTSGGNTLTRTIRYKPAAVGTQTSGATFGTTDADIGGLLIEIRPAGTNTITDSLNFSTTPILDSVTGVFSQATAPSAPWWNGRSAWTSTIIYQADDINIDRQILRVGSGSDTRFAMTRKAVGSAANITSIVAGDYSLADGTVRIESFSAAQGLGPRILAISQSPPDLYVDNIDKNPSFISGASFTGGLRLDSLPVEVGAHSGSGTLLPFTGKLARWIVDSRASSFEQTRVLYRALMESHLLWGQGGPNAPTDPNRGPVALPQVRSMTGSGPLVITPQFIDIDGTTPTLLGSSTTTGGGTTTIVGTDIHYTPAANFIGRDFFNYFVGDGQKNSLAWVAVDRLSAGLVAFDDTIKLQENTSLTFDPRTNDTGAQGPVTITAVTQPSIGSVSIEPNGQLRFVAPVIT